MLFLIYVSTAATPFSRDQLAALLAQSQAANRESGVTGMLLYKAGHFMQVLEGEADAIQTLYSKISRDTRHHNLIKLLENPRIERQFPQWAMGLYNLDSGEKIDMPGYGNSITAAAAAAEFNAYLVRDAALQAKPKNH